MTVRRGAVVLLVVAVVMAGVALVRAGEGPPPFSVRSTAPDGYAALATLLSERGVEVLEESSVDDASAGPGDALLVVPTAGTATDTEGLRRSARAGALVVVAGDPASPDPFATGPLGADARTLADTPTVPVATGVCDIDDLSDLGPIDALFAAPLAADDRRSCYGDGADAMVTLEPVGDGAVVTLASPLLWANARLHPAKEEGAPAPANGAMALRLLAGVDRLVAVDPAAGPPVGPSGTRDPLTLLPTGARLALAQLAGALALFVWWRSRRLGDPVSEPLPVEVAGSELVAAVGDLRRRHGGAGRDAEVLRRDVRRRLGERVGLGPAPDPLVLCRTIADRTGLDPERLRGTLCDDGDPVTGGDDLVALAGRLDAICEEALHDRPTAHRGS